MILCDPNSLNELVTKENYDNGYRVKIIMNVLKCENHVDLEKKINDFIQKLTDEFYIEGMSERCILVYYRTSLAGHG